MDVLPRQFRIAIAAVLLLAGCASQRPPEGGPRDTEAPFVVATSPENGTIRFGEREISFTFNEYVQRASFQEAVHISPLPDVPPSYEWSGRTATIVFDSALKANRTYVITVGTKVKDVRAGNPMLETVHLAFSTGDSLDRGTFSGTVSGDPAGGVSLFAYLLDSLRADTLDPAAERPDYAVQTSDDGAFHFYNVAPGSYRVFAVRDKSNDFRYNAESEDIGIPDRDIFVHDSTAPPPFRLFLHTEDTTRPAVQRIEALNERVVRIKFNETVYPQPLPLRQVDVRDSATGMSLPALSAVAPPDERYAWDVRLGAPLEETAFLLSLDSLVDGVGNRLDSTAFPMPFAGSSLPDTARPRILGMEPTENARAVEPDSAFRLSFDRPLAFGGAFTLTDSTGASLQVDAVSETPTDLLLRHPPLLGEAIYTLCIDDLRLVDSTTGRSVGDSARCIRFKTAKRDQYGTLAGTVRSADSGTVVVRIREAARNPKTRTQVTDSSRSFRFDGLPEGRYMLDAYVDRNGNRRYDFGKPHPIVRPEPYGLLRDTLRVRARWETNGIIVPLQSSLPPDSTGRPSGVPADTLSGDKP